MTQEEFDKKKTEQAEKRKARKNNGAKRDMHYEMEEDKQTATEETESSEETTDKEEANADEADSDEEEAAEAEADEADCETHGLRGTLTSTPDWNAAFLDE